MSREKAAPSAEVTTEVRGIAEMASEVRDSLMRLRALHRYVASSPSGDIMIFMRVPIGYSGSQR